MAISAHWINMSSNNPSQAPQASETAPSDKTVLAWTHTARFLTTASQLHHLPASELPEIAFVGRSNAGKSTAINTLAQQKRLAFASKTPGRTQLINFFRVASDRHLVDLPGYGYAAAAAKVRAGWEGLIGGYLQTRRTLRGVLLIMGCALTWQGGSWIWQHWLR